MRASCVFARGLLAHGVLERVTRVRVELYGSLALTGLGHATDRAVLLGLAGNEPATIEPTVMESVVAQARVLKCLALAGRRTIGFDEETDLVWNGAKIQHPNGVRLTALDMAGKTIEERTFFSTGGGFIREDCPVDQRPEQETARVQIPFPFASADQLLAVAEEHGLSISQLMLENECALRTGRRDDSFISHPSHKERGAPGEPENSPAAAVRGGIERLWQVMQASIERGMETEGILPGGLQVRRRARGLAERLRQKEADETQQELLSPLDWLTVYAMAVNEENAAGGRVVTAPTNGAAGVVPAVALYYQRFISGADAEGILRFFLASAAIGILYKENASISGAEVGCQGEVGVACSMAAAGLTAALGGTNSQIEHAAEVGMEHNLGMTCDPIGGLVQIPCIERNAMGAAKAVLASRMAMNETQGHKVSLDQVIRTMYLTGLDMQSRYKETSLAGLALNVIAC
jgi:L-serine dehydratase